MMILERRNQAMFCKDCQITCLFCYVEIYFIENISLNNNLFIKEAQSRPISCKNHLSERPQPY